MDNSYLVFKALHIVSFTAWLAALFYLPRLYVYHAAVKTGSETDILLQTMERRLQRAIMTPAMLATFLFGVLMALDNTALMQGGWFHAKLTLVFLMAGFHGYLCKVRRDFATGLNQRSGRFYRWINEIPTVLLIAIVLLAVIKPF